MYRIVATAAKATATAVKAAIETATAAAKVVRKYKNIEHVRQLCTNAVLQWHSDQASND